MDFKAWLNKWINPMDNEDKAWFLAFNTKDHMDERLIRNWFEKNQDPYFHAYFDYDKICVKEHALNFLRKKANRLKNKRLPTLYEEITNNKVDKNQWHTASYDVSLASELYFAVDARRKEEIITNYIRNQGY